ncbi:hypothetical protein KY337_04570 [Candidatus Woesearchaeota archaeon]|nr:hypothetical protein [Candidatus Woesearchaeota archaeon]
MTTFEEDVMNIGKDLLSVLGSNTLIPDLEFFLENVKVIERSGKPWKDEKFNEQNLSLNRLVYGLHHEHEGCTYLEYDVRCKQEGVASVREYFVKKLKPIFENYHRSIDQNQIQKYAAYIEHLCRSGRFHGFLAQRVLKELLIQTNCPICLADLEVTETLKNSLDLPEEINPDDVKRVKLWTPAAPPWIPMFRPEIFRGMEEGVNTFRAKVPRLVIDYKVPVDYRKVA